MAYEDAGREGVDESRGSDGRVGACSAVGAVLRKRAVVRDGQTGGVALGWDAQALVTF